MTVGSNASARRELPSLLAAEVLGDLEVIAVHEERSCLCTDMCVDVCVDMRIDMCIDVS